MKAKELRSMNDLDLDNKISELKKELMKSNSQIATGTLPKSPGKLKEMKRTIAKILTIKHEKILDMSKSKLESNSNKSKEAKKRNE